MVLRMLDGVIPVPRGEKGGQNGIKTEQKVAKQAGIIGGLRTVALLRCLSRERKTVIFSSQVMRGNKGGEQSAHRRSTTAGMSKRGGPGPMDVQL